MKYHMNHFRVRTFLLMLLSFLLVLSVTIPVFSAKTQSLSAVAETDTQNSLISESEIPAAIGTELAAQRGHALRLRASEPDLNTVVFRNRDQTQTMYIFDYPVKYINQAGDVQDISLEIADSETENGAFVTKSAPVETHFAQNLQDGVTVSAEDVSIRSVPVIPSAVSAANTVATRVDAETVSYFYGEQTAIEYSLTYRGYKEDIVVSSYTGQTEYQFRLFTNGLNLQCIDGSYYLVDGSGETKATIGDIIVLTADERNNCLGRMTHAAVREGEEYLLTIHLDAEYLQDEKTVYPIRIDPTVEIVYDQDGVGAIEDVTINSLQGSSGSSSSLFIGKRETYGISRTLMRFPNLSMDLVASSDQIIRAEVEMRDVLCESTSMTVYCYAFKGGAWDEDTASWSGVNPDSYGSLVGSAIVSYANGSSISHRYTFSITDAVIGWFDGTYDYAQGLIFKASSTVENASTYLHKTFASYNRSSNKPSVSIVYTNPFYSQFADSSDEKGTGTPFANELQYRANCYGYSLQTHLGAQHSVPVYSGGSMGYRHLVGEFIDKSDTLYLNPVAGQSFAITTYLDLANHWNDVMFDILKSPNFDSAQTLFYSMLTSLIQGDLESMGYSVTFTNQTAVNEPTTASKRLVIMVAGATVGTYAQPDYHFYLQHTDGSWSHKPGMMDATNYCKCESNPVLLTNDTILDHVQDGGYDDYLMFFYVTKPAVTDFANADGCETGFETKTELDCADVAGDFLVSAKKVSVPQAVQGRFDFDGDVDTYIFYANSTRYQFNFQKTLTGTSIDDYRCILLLLDQQGSMVTTVEVSDDYAVFFPTVTPGVYYLKVFLAPEADYAAGRNYTLSFSYLTT